MLKAFIEANATCCECGAPNVEWVATSVGVTLCADCATAHRRLGGDHARLRALHLDPWSPLVLT